MTIRWLAAALTLFLAPGFTRADEPMPPPAPKVRLPGLRTSTATAFADDTPEDIWKATCAACHGRDGAARTWLGKRNKVRDLTDAAWQAQVGDEAIRDAIRFGVDGTKMRGFEDKMTESQLVDLTRWVKALAVAR